MTEAAFPPPAGARPDWMEPLARTIDAAKKYVVSSTLDRVDWNAELVRAAHGVRLLSAQQQTLGRASDLSILAARGARDHSGQLTIDQARKLESQIQKLLNQE